MNEIRVSIGNHSSMFVPRAEREAVTRFYRDVLGGTISKSEPERDFLRLGDDFFIALLYADIAGEYEFLRSGKSIWLELKADDVLGMTQRILDSGLVTKLDIPSDLLYFQAPGGQCFRLVGSNDDLAAYEGVGDGPNVSRVKAALGQK